MRYCLLYLCTGLFFIQSVQAQIYQPKRLELEIGENEDYYEVISAGKKGIVLFREKDEKVKEGYIWEVLAYDTTLEQTLLLEFPIKFGNTIVGYEYYQEHLYLLYNVGEYRNDRLSLIKVEIATGDTAHINIEKPFPLELSDFKIFRNSILFGGYVNFRPAVVYYNFDEKKMKVLPGFYNNNSDLLEIIRDEDDDLFTVSMAERMPNRRYQVTLKTFTPDGKLVNSRSIIPKESLSFISGRVTTINDDIQFMAGTYANRKTEYSRGLYFARIQEDGDPRVLYYNYADLENFFNYMRAKREIRVKSRIERKKVKNKKNKFNYRLLVHDVIEKGDEYYLIGEAFYPKYSSTAGENPYLELQNSRARIPYGSMSFAGFKYTHAVIIAFDKNANIIWDNSFEINDVTSWRLEQYVKPLIREDEIILLYNYENVIRSKIIRENEIIEGKSFDEIELKFEDDMVKNNDFEFGGLERWYDDYFFAYGIQRIKNLKDSGVKLNRRVFFINKVFYE